MPTDYDGPFKQLFEDVSDKWLMLPIHVRGIGCEILRVSSRVSGKVGDTRDTLPLLRKLGADRSEAAMVEEAVTALLAQGFLSEGSDGTLYVTNLAKLQERKRAEWREKKKAQRGPGCPKDTNHVPECPPVSTSVPKTTPLSPHERRGEEIYDPENSSIDLQPPAEPLALTPPEPVPPPASEPRPKPAPKPRKPPTAPHPVLVEHYVAEFTRIRGEKPPFDGRDAKAIAKILGTFGGDVEKSKRVITHGLSAKLGNPQTVLTIANDPAKWLAPPPEPFRGVGREGPPQSNTGSWKSQEVPDGAF